MWSRRKEEEQTPRSSAPPTSAELAREGIPVSTMPTRSPEPETARGAAIIGKSVVMKGQIYSREDLYIDGEIEGTLELQEHRLTVGPHGKVQAAIKAREVVIVGTVHGNVEAADKIDIRKDAKLVGDIKTSRIVIEDGAYFKGSIDISKPEMSRAPVPPRPQPAAAAAAAPAQQQSPTAGQADPKR
jgi:cytoskeletal protein CcmA (bactofilin family)